MDRTLSMKSATMTSRAALADGHGGFVLEDIQVHPPVRKKYGCGWLPQGFVTQIMIPWGGGSLGPGA